MLTKLPNDHAAAKRPVRSYAGRVELSETGLSEIPQTSPVHRIGSTYERLLEQCENQHLPSIADFLGAMPEGLDDFCLILAPVRAQRFIDFEVMHRGSRIPGIDLAELTPGELYTDRISPKFADERLMELASCMALKAPRYSRALSARPSSLNVRVYRAVMPVWLDDSEQHGVVLAIAPVYEQTDPEAA